MSLTWEELMQKIKNGWSTNDPEILKRANKFGKTVAHLLSEKGWTTEDKDILILADKDGITVALNQVYYSGWTTEDPEILKRADKSGWTVAHEQARIGWTTNNIEILSLTDNEGQTVAFLQAKRGWITDDPDALILKGKMNGVEMSVFDLQIKRGWIPDLENPKIRKIFENGDKKGYYNAVVENWYYEDDIEKVAKHVQRLYNFYKFCKENYNYENKDLRIKIEKAIAFINEQKINKVFDNVVKNTTDKYKKTVSL